MKFLRWALQPPGRRVEWMLMYFMPQSTVGRPHSSLACRFDYSQDFLKWALQPPGTRAEWVLGVRVAASGKLVGFITAVPARVRVRATSLAMVEINYLCVHKKLRAKRLAPVLIKVRAHCPYIICIWTGHRLVWQLGSFLTTACSRKMHL